MRRRKPWLAAAAAVLLLLAAGGFWFNREKKQPIAQQPVQLPLVASVLPGGNKAVLTLGDGTVIALDSSGNGVLAQQGNMKIVKQANGQLAYEQARGRGRKKYCSIPCAPPGERVPPHPAGRQPGVAQCRIVRYLSHCLYGRKPRSIHYRRGLL